MPPPRMIVKYTIDLLLIFVPLAAVTYFLFNPSALQRVYGLAGPRSLELDPEKWRPVFRKDHAPGRKIGSI